MCGINGITYQGYNKVKSMNKASQWRGPDAMDVWSDDHVTLGHTLLKISGNTLSESIQPHITEKGNVLIFNGQLYGIGEFDTPYLGRMLDYYGVSYLSRVNGMFALAYYVPSTGNITIARDHCGQKPLFYSLDDGLEFSSSLHSMRKIKDLVIDENNKKYFASFSNFWVGWRTLYKGVYKLYPGQYITYNVHHDKIMVNSHLHDYQISDDNDITDAEIKDLIEYAIQSTMKNKHKTALMLSGGLDSTLILNCASKMKDLDLFCVTNSFEEHLTKETITRYFDEADMAHKSAEYYNVPIVDCHLNYGDVNKYAEEIMDVALLPLMDRNRTVPRYLSYKTAAMNGAKIVATGDCGDEIFTGYTAHSRFENESFFARKKNVIDDVERDETLSWFPKEVLGKDKVNNELFFLMFQQVDTFNILSDGLASYFSMESRTPFCHQKLFRTMMTIDGRRKIKRIKKDIQKGTTKYFIRGLFKNELPKHVTDRTLKTGWASPWDSRDYELNIHLAKKDIENLENKL